jgi:hypothetical protein
MGEYGDNVAEYQAEKKRIEGELAALDSEQSLADVAAAVNWEKPVEVINNTLRAMWSEVRLDENLMPMEAEWIVPEWRA